jgi:replication-associated recombination protein RarA
MVNGNIKIPLADRMRPENLDEFIGQEEIVGRENYCAKLLNLTICRFLSILETRLRN